MVDKAWGCMEGPDYLDEISRISNTQIPVTRRHCEGCTHALWSTSLAHIFQPVDNFTATLFSTATVQVQYMCGYDCRHPLNLGVCLCPDISISRIAPRPWIAKQESWNKRTLPHNAVRLPFPSVI